MTTLSEIEKLVSKVAQEALQDNADGLSLSDKVEALKVLTPYYLSLKKDNKPEDDETGTMADFATAMKEPHASKVRGHRGRQ